MHRGLQRGALLRRGRLHFVCAVSKKPLGTVAPPDFRMRMNAHQEDQLGCRPPADENYASSVTHDSRHKFGNFAIRERTRAIRRKRCKSAVVIQQKNARPSATQLLEKRYTNIL